MIDVSRARDFVDKVTNPQVGWVAIFALLLGMCNTCYQVLQLASNAEPQLLVPEQILIVPDKYPTGHIFVRFAVRFSYVNIGPPQKSTVITKEALSYTLGNQTFLQKWQSFETFAGRTCELSSAESKDVHPIILSGKDAASHITYFAPRAAPEEEDVYLNFQTLENFVQATLEQSAIEFYLQSELLGGNDVLTQVCTVRLTSSERENLRRGCATTISCR